MNIWYNKIKILYYIGYKNNNGEDYMDILEARKEKILAFLKNKGYVPLKMNELVQVLDVPIEDIVIFKKILTELENEGRIQKTKRERYIAVNQSDIIKGKYRGNERGFGFVMSDDRDKDIFIPPEKTNGAMNNDIVLAKLIKEASSQRREEGEIYRIVERSNNTFVGTFIKNKSFGFVIPDDKRINNDIFISNKDTGKANSKDKVVIEIINWPSDGKKAEGRIIEVIGRKNSPGVDVMSVIRAYRIPTEFPEEVLIQADKIFQTIQPDVLKNRRDLRSTRIVTIDGADAKDLDDAVSIEELGNENYRLGVHIADVSYYVTENSFLDKEALKRGTSVYFADRVIPMLPQKLSNGICSLNKEVDRLTLSVVMDIDSEGNVTAHEIFESVINVDKRMTYTDVYNILQNETTELLEIYKDNISDFKIMKKLATILTAKRRKRGAIDFDFPEAKVVLDENGKTIDIQKRELTIANKIIEEFMLVCNETVAERFEWLEIPFIYRIHEEPDPEKIETFARFATNAGYSLKSAEKIHPKMLQSLAEQVKGTNKERIISTMMLRSMRKARYSAENMGHFGLSARYYCHFTSPIRRYPDLIIHRIIKEHLHGKLKEKRLDYYMKTLPDTALWCSEREITAEESEREVEDIKKTEYMANFIGDVFKAIISSVTSFGMFVELPNTVEGLIRLDYLEDDYYVYNETNMIFTGERTGKVYSIGDEITVQLVSVNVDMKQIDFYPYDENRDLSKKQDKPSKTKKKIK